MNSYEFNESMIQLIYDGDNHRWPAIRQTRGRVNWIRSWTGSFTFFFGMIHLSHRHTEVIVILLQSFGYIIQDYLSKTKKHLRIHGSVITNTWLVVNRKPELPCAGGLPICQGYRSDLWILCRGWNADFVILVGVWWSNILKYCSRTSG